MDYAGAVEAAPPGWRHFEVADLDRLPRAVRQRALTMIPPDELELVHDGDPEAQKRARRALFWTFVYHLEPKKWEMLASVEPIHPEALAAIPSARRALDIGAGGGRLTTHLVTRCDRVAAIEPSLGLASILKSKLPTAITAAGWAEALPIGDGWSDLTAACGALAPEQAILDEMRRVTSVGGLMLLISPERPEEYERLGWTRISLDPIQAPKHERWIDEFFGPPDPPHELVMSRRVEI